LNLFHANGKLLISGEYAVLDGAVAFAVPTRFGQTLEVNYSEESDNPVLFWEAFRYDGSLWFSTEFDLETLTVLKTTDAKFASRLLQIFKAASELNSGFFQNPTQNIHCKTRLEFPQDWGLGSSSTLIYLLAKWMNIDEFKLNDLAFKTSGYDVACAGIDSPVIYRNHAGVRTIQPINFQPEFIGQLSIVHLNRKQDTQTNVSNHYRDLPKDPEWIQAVSEVSVEMAKAQTLPEFEVLMNLHEDLIASKLGFQKAKDLHFPDYEGSVKSLGAWGGDFVLVTEREGFLDYFQSKGFGTVLALGEVFI